MGKYTAAIFGTADLQMIIIKCKVVTRFIASEKKLLCMFTSFVLVFNTKK